MSRSLPLARVVCCLFHESAVCRLFHESVVCRLFHESAAAAAAAAAVVCRLQQAPSVAVEDRAIAAASIRDGRPPNERLTLAMSEVRQSRTDVSGQRLERHADDLFNLLVALPKYLGVENSR